MLTECEYLFCQQPATRVITAPFLPPDMPVCDEHRKTLADFAANYRVRQPDPTQQATAQSDT